MKQILRYALLLQLAILILGFAGCTKKQASDQSSSGSTASAANVAEVTNVTPRQDMVPNFSWKDSAGHVVDFDSFRGKATLVNFWATWCGPCKKELPDLVALSKDMAGRDVRVIGISTDRGTNVLGDVRTFVAEHGIPYQVVVSNEDLEEAFGNIRVIPTTFLIDANGKIVQTIVGARSKEAFGEAIAAVLK